MRISHRLKNLMRRSRTATSFRMHVISVFFPLFSEVIQSPSILRRNIVETSWIVEALISSHLFTCKYCTILKLTTTNPLCNNNVSLISPHMTVNKYNFLFSGSIGFLCFFFIEKKTLKLCLFLQSHSHVSGFYRKVSSAPLASSHLKLLILSMKKQPRVHTRYN
jgi:hypothetical protein